MSQAAKGYDNNWYDPIFPWVHAAATTTLPVMLPSCYFDVALC